MRKLRARSGSCAGPTRSSRRRRLSSRRSSTARIALVRFISEHKARFGVEPICRVLTEHGCPIAPSTYYDAARRAPSARAVRDEQLKAAISRVHQDNFGVYGARKVWLALNREGIPVARCTVERLMRELGLHGARRGKKVRTTVPAAAAARPADLVRRQFSPAAPDRLWVADFAYSAQLAVMCSPAGGPRSAW